MIKNIVLLFSMLLLVCGCRYPTTNVSTGDSRPTLSFNNAPKGSYVWVDGINMGHAAQYNGNPKVLIVQPGTHEVKVTLENILLTKQTIFVESQNKVINIQYPEL